METKCKVIGELEGKFESLNRVYDVGGCPTLNTFQGGNREPKILISQETISTSGKKIDVASTILNGYHRTNMTGFNADNGVLETEVEVLNPMPDGTCRTLKNQYGKNSVDNFDSQGSFGASGVIETVKIRQNNKKGYIDCEIGGVADLSFPDSKTRRGRCVDNGNVSPTITAQGADSLCRIESRYRIRKLTPRECWRLMDFSDDDFDNAEAVNSNTQLYKQAGNSIVVNVLVAILGQLFDGKENVYKEI